MTLWLTFILSVGSFAFGAAVYRGFAKGSTNLPMKVIEIEEFDKDSIYFWGVMAFNALACLGLAVAAVFAYVNDWGAFP